MKKGSLDSTGDVDILFDVCFLFSFFLGGGVERGERPFYPHEFV